MAEFIIGITAIAGGLAASIWVLALVWAGCPVDRFLIGLMAACMIILSTRELLRHIWYGIPKGQK